MMGNLVITHDRCMDGFVAGRVAAQALGRKTAIYRANHGNPPPWHLITPDVAVYILDFAYDRETLLKIHETARFLAVLDHHKSAEEQLRGLPFCTFDMERSGAGLAWDHFFMGEPRPWLVDYAEDRDLWRFALPDSKAVNAAINATPFDDAEFDELEARGLDRAITDGTAILRYMDAFVLDTVKNARKVVIGEHTVMLCSCTRRGLSEVGHHLAPQADFAMCWYQQSDGRYLYSLRSIGEFDVSAFARQYGGGGHRNAAGFVHHEHPGNLPSPGGAS